MQRLTKGKFGSTKILAACFPIIVCLFIIPIEIYRDTGNVIGLTMRSLVPSFIVSALAIAAVSIFMRWSRVQPRTAAAWFLAGLFILLSYALFPTQWHLLASTEELRWSWPQAAAQAALFLALFLIWRRAPPARIIAIAVPIIIAVTLGSGARLYAAEHDRGNDSATTKEAAERQRLAIARPNIYHFVFDGYSSLAFPHAVRDPGLQAAFTGFTVFPDNLANYIATDASLPSFLRGELFPGGSFRAFQEAAREGGIRRRLAQNGYAVSIYVPDRTRFWFFETADTVRTNQDIERRSFDPDGSISLAQMTTVRIVPLPLRWLVLKGVQLAIPKSAYKYYKQQSVKLIDAFLHDERLRPDHGQYVYVHLLLPHLPYRLAPDCRAAPPGTATYDGQAHCANLLMADVAAGLRRLRHFDNSLIIFQGDHGFHEGIANPRRHIGALPPAVHEKLARSGDEFDPDEIALRIRALLLVKPPGAAPRPLQRSNAPAQLLDIPATMSEAVGLSIPVGEGRPLFSLGEAEPRERHFFAGIGRKGGIMRKRLGRDFARASLAHISLDTNGRWRIYPDVQATEDR